MTKNTYNHVAFAFDPFADKLYSYARFRYNEPFLAGFGIEFTDRYVGNLHNTFIKICEYSVDDEFYDRLKDKIEEYVTNQELTQYNFFSLFTYPFHRSIDLPYTHTCVSFLSELLEMPAGIKISEFEDMLDHNIVFQGSLDDFIKTNNLELNSGDIDFYEKRRFRTVARENCSSIYTLVKKVMPSQREKYQNEEVFYENKV